MDSGTLKTWKSIKILRSKKIMITILPYMSISSGGFAVLAALGPRPCSKYQPPLSQHPSYRLHNEFTLLPTFIEIDSEI